MTQLLRVTRTFVEGVQVLTPGMVVELSEGRALHHLESGSCVLASTPDLPPTPELGPVLRLEGKPWSLRYSGGIGDWFVLDSILTEDERRTLTAIYWGHPNRKVLEPTIKANPLYAKVTHHCERHERDTIPPDAQQWDLRWFYDLQRKHRVSSFATHQLADVDLDLPDRFVVIQAETPANCDHHRGYRDLHRDEWQKLIERLETEGIDGVVLNSADATQPPKHPRIHDYQGKTTLAESIEVLKRAQGFYGIASCLSVLAAQLFPADRLWIKGPEINVKQFKWRYFAPHRSYPFLVDHLVDHVPEPLDTEGREPVVALQSLFYQNRWISPGELVWVEFDRADIWTQAAMALREEDWCERADYGSD